MFWRLLLLGGLLAWLPLGSYADPALDKAQMFLKEGKADSAGAIYAAYLQQHPTALPAELALANLAMRRFEYPKARALLEKALAQHPEAPEVPATLGRLFQLWSNSPAGKPTDKSRNYLALAQEHFRQAMALGANHPLVLAYYAEWQIQQNDLVGAERNLYQALKLQPTFVPAFQGLARFYIKARDMQRAKDTVLHAMELDPLDATNYFLTAQMLGIANRPAEAVKYAVKSEQLDYGKLPERDYFLAMQYEKLGELPQATAYYEKLTVYTPRDAQIWLKLGDLYDALNQADKSLAAYQKALSLKPDVLQDLARQARDNTRNERVESALGQWRRLIALQPTNPEVLKEAMGAMAGLHYLNFFYHPQQKDASASRDYALFEHLQPAGPDSPLPLDKAKMMIALQGSVTPPLRQTLQQIMQSPDPAVAGEAAFLAGDLARAAEQLEQVDGLSEQEYARVADRLLLVQALAFAKVFYERANQLTPDPSLQTALKRIQAKQALAEQRVKEGDSLFNAKKYTDAIDKYQEAVRISRESDHPYLRLGDAYERLKQWKAAKQAYDTAISLSPGLLESEGFSKNYQRLQKKAAAK